MSDCPWTWSSLNSVSGWRVTGTNGNKHLPACCGIQGNYTNYYFEDKCGSYMTATQEWNRIQLLLRFGLYFPKKACILDTCGITYLEVRMVMPCVMLDIVSSHCRPRVLSSAELLTWHKICFFVAMLIMFYYFPYLYIIICFVKPILGVYEEDTVVIDIDYLYPCQLVISRERLSASTIMVVHSIVFVVSIKY